MLEEMEREDQDFGGDDPDAEGDDDDNLPAMYE